MRAIMNRLRGASSGADQGIALLVVIGLGMLMLALVATGLTVALSGLKKTDTDQDWNGALDAAYAGVEEYQSRLATDNSYYTYGNKDAPFSIQSGSTKLVLPTGTATNTAFGIGAAGSWATVPGSTPVASFRYEVDSTSYAADGSIRIRSTGRVGTVTRSVVADLKQSGFIDYLYFTDFEVQDPELTGNDSCAVHEWENRSNSCDAIQFGKNDTLSGPVHSNDTLHICGSTFNKKVTSSNPASPYYVNECSTTQIKFNGGAPQYQAALTMPPTNVQMKKETRNDLTASEVPFPGCLYTGPTEITFTSDGKMNVKSPWTVYTNVSQANTTTGATNPAACGTPGTGGLGAVGGQTIDVLPSNVIYVQNVPTVTSDANYRSATPANFSCVNSNAGWTFGTSKYPTTDETTPAAYGGSTAAYGCKNGDVYVKGAFKGAMTIAAENYIYVTGDITYADESKDILGLVGNNAVWVWNPMKKSGSSTYTALLGSNRTIEAAILSVAHTFQVQNYTLGSSRGTLTIFGSIAQKFRGPVGTSSSGTIVTGYAKKYDYDTRFAYMAPPKFLSPVSSAYGVTQFAGVPAAFLATGATAP